MVASELDELFADLNQHSDRIDVETLLDWFQRTNVTFSDVSDFLRFHPKRYMRNLIYRGQAFQALVLCWRNGQRSPIHDHVGSSCGVKVLHGEAMETIFSMAPNGMIFPTSTTNLEEGSTTASQDSDIHQVSNLQPAQQDLVTLHIYSPPLLSMNTYSLFDTKRTPFLDPINMEFYEGAGI